MQCPWRSPQTRGTATALAVAGRLTQTLGPAWIHRTSPSTRLAEASRLVNLSPRLAYAPALHRLRAKARLRAHLGAPPRRSTICPPPSCRRAGAPQEGTFCLAGRWRSPRTGRQGASVWFPRAPVPGARCAALALAGLTGRSTGPATASRLGRAAPWFILHRAAQAPCLRGPVNYNVRQGKLYIVN